MGSARHDETHSLNRTLSGACELRETRITNRWTGATGSVFRIKRDPAKLLGNAVARSTQPFDAFSNSSARYAAALQNALYRRSTCTVSLLASLVRSINDVPDDCAAIHVNVPLVFPEPDQLQDMDEFEQATVASLAHWGEKASAISSSSRHGRKRSAMDSPVGQAAWIHEKMWVWTDNQRSPVSF